MVEPAGARRCSRAIPLSDARRRARPRRGASGLGRGPRGRRATCARQRYDVALDFQGLWKSAAWARLSGARARRRLRARAGGASRSRALLVRERVALPAEAGPRDRQEPRAAARRSASTPSGTREFPLPPTRRARRARSSAALARRGARGDFVVLNPGGGWASKLWPRRVVRRAGARAARARACAPLVTWGPGEEALADAWWRRRTARPCAASRPRCSSYVELARRARLVVAADTGPLHLACAVGTPVVGIFGPTDPARNGPFSPRTSWCAAAPPCAPVPPARRCPCTTGVMDAIAGRRGRWPRSTARLGPAPRPRAVAV